MRKTQVFALLNHANEDLNKIESEYNNALKNKTIPDSLKIDIKNFLENLRSSLDYMAHDIYEQKIEPYRKVNNKQDVGNIYFPYGENVNAFKSRIGACLPELNNIDKNLYSLIESIQPHLTNDNWLCDFCNITNEKKHNLLTPQKKVEKNETFLGNAVKVGTAGKVAMKRCLVEGIPVNSNDINNEPLENFDPRLKVKRIVWVSFEFSDTNIVVLPFLKKVCSNINSFSNRVYSYI